MRRINRCLNTKLQELCQRAIQLETLNKELCNHLPLSLKDHCRVGSFSTGCLTLIVSDAVWASQLRYFLPELRDKLRSETGLYQLVTIKVVVQQETLSIAPKKQNATTLSPKARDIIRTSSAQFHYKPLQEAWLRIALRNTDAEELV